MSGPYSGSGGYGSAVGTQLAADDFGCKLGNYAAEILSADHQNKPDIAASIVRGWIDVKDVDAIADGGTSPCAVTIQQICRERRKTFVISAAASGGLTGALRTR